MYQRYAIYYTPQAGTPLASFGAQWLGWDSAAGTTCPQPEIDGLDVDAVTHTPRKYGFHGTIKPPFRLADGMTDEALSEALADFCAGAGAVTLEGLHLARLGRFLALVPTGDASALGALAARAVQELDVFRAPPTEAELVKRRATSLNPEQEAHLERWGYPYVLDQFRFHMTLSGNIAKPVAEAVEAALAAPLEELDLAPYRINGLTLLGEDDAGMFHQIHRYALTG
jgi:putative phosphonate metabolism protein